MHTDKLIIFTFAILLVSGSTYTSEINNNRATLKESTPTSADYIKYHLFTLNNGCWVSENNKEIEISKFNEFFSNCGKGFGKLTNENLLEFHSLLAQCGVNYGYSFKQCEKHKIP